jgi:hypothetical protein
MERGSDKHSPRLDDQMAHETSSLSTGAPVEARAQEWRTQEGAADGEPEVDAVLTHSEVEERSDIARFLELSAFPADRGTLLSVAERNQAPDAVLHRLQSLPEGQGFENVQQVWEALGGGRESRV